MRLTQYLKEDKFDKVVKDFILPSYGSIERPDTPPLKGFVFRVISDREWESIKKGYYSGSLWASDPTDYGEYAKKGGMLLIAKDSGMKQYRGLDKKQFNNLEKKELEDVAAAFEFTGGKFKRIKF